MKLVMDNSVGEAYRTLGLQEGAVKRRIGEQYLKLAESFHPEKYGHNPDALKNFRQVSLAYEKLVSSTTSNWKKLKTIDDMIEMLNNVRLGEYTEESSGEEGGAWSHVTSNQNKEELNSEEEREKRAAKRRDKKKRRKEKKRLEKQGIQPETLIDTGISSKIADSSDSDSNEISPWAPISVGNNHASVTNDLQRNSPFLYQPPSALQPVNSQSSIANHQTSIANQHSTIANQHSTIPNHQPTIPNHQPTIPNHQPTIPNHQSTIPNQPIGSIPFDLRFSNLTGNGYNNFIRPPHDYLENSLAPTVAPARNVGVIGEKPPQPTEQRPDIPRSAAQLHNGNTTAEAIAEARKYAIQGNKHAGSGDLDQAVVCFSRAIQLDPTDHRFYGNRSYCYDKINEFESALRDADLAISMKPNWPKGYFRRGRALAGLQASKPRGTKNYDEVEKAFLTVLKLDTDCEDAVTELEEVRVLALVEMGFPESSAREAIRLHGSREKAVEELLSINADEVYESDDESSQQSAPMQTVAPKVKKQPLIVCREPAKPAEKGPGYDRKLDPANPDGLLSVWVGNIQNTVTEKDVRKLFSKCGELTGIRLMPEKFCAFINFKSPEGAGKAMEKLQGFRIGGQNLLIKFPDNPIKMSMTKPITSVTAASSAAAKKSTTGKKSGPVLDGECYYWRTTGCQYGTKCNYLHVPSHQGVDKQPWHVKK